MSRQKTSQADNIDICAFLIFRHLNMSFNLIRDLPSRGFVGLATLEALDLSHNDLREIDDAAFDGLDWLSTLRLNDNNICRVRADAFVRTISLNELSLRNNRLTRIYEDAFGAESRRRISRVDVAGKEGISFILRMK